MVTWQAYVEWHGYEPKAMMKTLLKEQFNTCLIPEVLKLIRDYAIHDGWERLRPISKIENPGFYVIVDQLLRERLLPPHIDKGRWWGDYAFHPCKDMKITSYETAGYIWFGSHLFNGNLDAMKNFRIVVNQFMELQRFYAVSDSQVRIMLLNYLF